MALADRIAKAEAITNSLLPFKFVFNLRTAIADVPDGVFHHLL